MKICNKILYVGAGHHLDPVVHFRETKEFLFIDTQPRSEFDSECPQFHIGFYRKKFVDYLIDICEDFGFILESEYVIDNKYHQKVLSLKQQLYYFFDKTKIINPTLLVFTNKTTNQTIKYYISTNIKFNMTPILKQNIESCDGIIISGYHPCRELLNYFTNSKLFIGYTETCYNIVDNNNITDEDKNNIIYFLETCLCSISYYFNGFYIVDYHNGNFEKCTNFNEFKSKLSLYSSKNEELDIENEE